MPQEPNPLNIESKQQKSPAKLNVLNGILAKRDERRSSSGNIIIPDTVDEKKLTAIVVAVSKYFTTQRGDMRYENEDVKVGNRVVVNNQFSGAQLMINGVEYMKLQPHEVFAIIEGNGKLVVDDSIWKQQPNVDYDITDTPKTGGNNDWMTDAAKTVPFDNSGPIA